MKTPHGGDLTRGSMSGTVHPERWGTSYRQWDEAFSTVRERNAPEVVVVSGRRYKIYPSGRVLCAGCRPYHRYVEGPCPMCDAVSDGIIATLTVPR